MIAPADAEDDAQTRRPRKPEWTPWGGLATRRRPRLFVSYPSTFVGLAGVKRLRAFHAGFRHHAL
jgi:hypothetical protein